MIAALLLNVGYIAMAGLIGGIHYGMGLDMKGDNPPSIIVGCIWPLSFAYMVVGYFPMKLGIVIGERTLASAEKKLKARKQRLALLAKAEQEISIAEKELEIELESDSQRRLGS